MTLQHDYPTAPAELFAVLVDPEYLQARQERFGGVGAPVIETDGQTTTVTTVRQLPLDKVPAAFRSFVGDGQVEQIDTWRVGDTRPGADAEIRGEWRASVGTAPATIDGTHAISAADDGSHYEITTNVSVKIPFFGGKVEEQIMGYLEHLIGKEQAYLADWVAER